MTTTEMTQKKKVEICVLHQLVLANGKMNRQEACVGTPSLMLSLFGVEKDWENNQSVSREITELEKHGFVIRHSKDVEIAPSGYRYYAQWAAKRLGQS